MRAAPIRLRVEHLDDGLGIGDREPRLSWQLPAASPPQLASRIRAGHNVTGWCEGPDSVLVPWPFAPLDSRTAARWQVQVRTDAGDSPWSEEFPVETGLLSPTDWSAQWISPTEPRIAPAGERPGYELRGTVPLAAPVAAARLYATAHGIYEAFLNGQRVGDLELTPGFTQYKHRLQVQTFDVTDLLVIGENEFGAVLTDGWYRGQIGITRAPDQWGTRTAFLAQLHVTYTDGTAETFGTDMQWRSRVSAISAADLIAGQSEDRRRVGEGDWSPVALAEFGFDTLVCSASPPVRRVQEVRAAAVTTLDNGSQVVDLGQNINGWLRLAALGPAGTELTLTHGEALDEAGDVTTDHLMPAVPFLPHPLPAGMVDHVISAGRPGDVFEPRHTTHGFAFVRIEGAAQQLSTADVTGVVVHSDLRRTGWFTSSDKRINKLHDAAVWSLRDNICDVPTDCPTRERAGWTGDWQLYIPTAAFLYDVAGFSAKWLADVALDQWPDGTIANMSPAGRSEGRDSPIQHLNGSAGWGDAAVIVPWEIYQAYGDDRLLADLWPTMVGWLDRAERLAATGRHPSRTGDPAPHEKYLWDNSFHWGEWLEPGQEIGDFGQFIRRDKSDVATAYFAHSAALMARIAGVLGRAQDAARYEELAGNVRAAWRTEFLTSAGTLPSTQANLVRALRFELLPTDRREAAVDQLVELIRAADNHLGTGFLATPDLLPVLADGGRADVAYELLFQDTEPSWLTMIDRGATTMWEWWDGVNTEGKPRDSLNHYSKGAVITFLHRYTAGIRPGDTPAYRDFRIEPVVGGGITSAQAALETPYGRIESGWTLTDGRLDLAVLVPPGTSAAVTVAGRSVERVGPGQHAFSAQLS